MKAKEILLVAAIAVFLFIAARALFPTASHFDIVMSGTPGAKVTGSYDCDGVVTSFASTLPATLSCDVKRDFIFHVTKNEKSDSITLGVKSDTFSGQCDADPHARGIEVSYHAPVKGFMSKSVIRAVP